MKNNPFHSLNRRAVGAAAVTAALLVPLGVFGGPALARSTSVASSGPAQYQYKINVCHRTHSKKHPWVLIRVSSRSWPAHQRHGDLLVPPSTCPPTAAPTTAAGSASNGKGNGNGNNGKSNNGNSNNGKGHGK